MVEVSVVVPAFNSARYIAATVESILAQSHSDFELIISDHASTDGTVEILTQYAGDARVRLIETESGGGAGRNWNRVSQAATGDLLKLVCADDLLHPHALERQVEVLRAHPGCVLVASPRSIIRSDGSVVLRRRGLGGLRREVAGPEAVRQLVRAGTNLLGEPVCVTMRASALERAGWWDAHHPYVIDQATYARVLAQGDLYALDEVLASFRVSSQQWSVALEKAQYAQNVEFHQWALEQHPDVVREGDVRIGNIRSWVDAKARSAVYRLMALSRAVAP